MGPSIQVRQILKTTRPVIFDNEDPDWRYSTKGSCVVVSVNERKYAITALHVSEGYRPSQFLISYEEGSDTFLPLKESFVIRTPENNDTDHKDVLFFEIWQDKIEEDLWKKEYCFNIAWNEHAQISERTVYWVSGYPHEINNVDFDNTIIQSQATHISGRCIVNERFIGINEFEFSSDGGLSSFQGFSGGGVFSFTPVREGEANVRFEGMMLRATKESMRGFYVRADVIKNCILRQQRGVPDLAESSNQNDDSFLPHPFLTK